MPTSSYPFESANPYDPKWTDKAYDLICAGQIQAVIEISDQVATEVVKGPCPRCQEDFTYTAPATAVTGGVGVLGAKDAVLPSEWRSIELYCACAGPHAGRPPDKQGCGIAYSVPARITPK